MSKTMDLLKKLQPLSKSTLQNIRLDSESIRTYDIYNIITRIQHDILREAGYKTFYKCKIGYSNYEKFDTTEYVLEFKEAFALAFPDCKTDYVNKRGFDGRVVERIASVDWS